ncbi:serine hydrolase domain-containing protein [Pseudonocardia humida]|uniref:serine hydrolase domain-containing protein n=1 Tax=Pseudonocardia humida TaxID=2800819 RepID=UPI00207CAF6E|nr:serine hydrolase domain-containing protein [Pseudonocardia humida]
MNRRRLLGWSGLAAGAVAVGVPLVGAGIGNAAPTGSGAPAPPGDDAVPPDTLPGGAYDRYVAELAAADEFSGVVVLSHRGRTVLSRSYGLADQEKGIANDEGVAFNLGSAVQPFASVAILQLAQQGKVRLADLVGTHLDGFATDVAERVRIHHLLTNPGLKQRGGGDLQRVFESREEVHAFYEEWTRQSELVAPPGSEGGTAQGAVPIIAQIVEAVTGTTYWDYVHEHVFGRCGMTGSAFYTRPEWLSDEHIAHSYMRQADGSRVDAVRNLDKGSVNEFILGKNPGRNFIDGAADGGFATAADLVRFGQALGDGTLLDRPYADMLLGAKFPQYQGKAGQPPPPPGAPEGFGTYGPPGRVLDGQWVVARAGGNAGSGANWTIYRDTGWVGVILSNYDDFPLIEMIQQENEAVTGFAEPPGGGGGG